MRQSQLGPLGQLGWSPHQMGRRLGLVQLWRIRCCRRGRLGQLGKKLGQLGRR